MVSSHNLKDEDWEDASGETTEPIDDIPGFEGTMDALDDITIRPTNEPDPRIRYGHHIRQNK